MTARVVYIIPQHPQLNTPRCNISCLLRVNYHVVYRGTEKKTLGGALGEPHFKQENHISQMIEFLHQNCNIYGPSRSIYIT